MLDLFRQKGVTSVVYGTILVATLVVFVVQFRPNSGPQAATLRRSCAATIRGNCIDPKDQRATFRLLMPRGPDGESSMKQARSMGLTRLSLEALIDRELLIAEADRLGLAVSDKEVDNEIVSGWIHVSTPLERPEVALRMPPGKTYAGFKDAKTKDFDYKVFERTVRYATGRSSGEFREWQKREILAAKVREALAKNVNVGEAEAFQFYRRDQERARVAYASVNKAYLRSWAVEAGEAELDAWIAKKENADTVQGVFESRKESITPHENHLRHILVGAAPDADAKVRGEALTKLSAAVERVRRGEAFSEVAREVSTDLGSGSRGGELGDKTDGFVAPFRTAANALKPGELTAGAIETQFGFHAILRDDPSKAEAVLAAARRSIARELLVSQKIEKLGEDFASTIRGELAAGKAPSEVAAALAAPYASRTRTVTLLPVVRDTSLDSDAGAPPRSYDPSGLLAAASDADRPSGGESSFFGRGQEPFAGLSSEGVAAVTGFAMSGAAGEILDGVAPADAGFAVVRLLERKAADRDAFLKDRDAFIARYTQAKRLEALAVYLKRARERAKAEITIDPKYQSEPAARGDSGDESEGE